GLVGSLCAGQRFGCRLTVWAVCRVTDTVLPRLTDVPACGNWLRTRPLPVPFSRSVRPTACSACCACAWVRLNTFGTVAFCCCCSCFVWPSGWKPFRPFGPFCPFGPFRPFCLFCMLNPF